MCIGIPVRLVERDEYSGIGEIEGVQRRISLALVPEAKLGDYVLVHAGCGMQVIDEEAAAETLELLRTLEDEAY
jgi:hydrogenase expression/formation protein HypC